ncbi:YdeI/OmpD-associated family protein [Rubrolithibacter danxiaensis]|uniref:YdeI/OmpD-associated family protein n=1 Tax=Rubrolithibacter danxiaensis TaxID=3390805 RepID=UPI003BF7A541
MVNKDQRIDAYIDNSAGFAKAILDHLRSVIHTACPEIQETIKWGFPHFEYKGTVCSMAAFKQHCAFTFWKASLLTDPKQLFKKKLEQGMGQLGQISSLADLPHYEILIEYIREAVQLNISGKKVLKTAASKEKKELEIPNYFEEFLKQNSTAHSTFNNFSYSHKKEYIEWITEAKTEDTRNKRMATALQWIAEGKSRNWKYAKK